MAWKLKSFDMITMKRFCNCACMGTTKRMMSLYVLPLKLPLGNISLKNSVSYAMPSKHPTPCIHGKIRIRFRKKNIYIDFFFWLAYEIFYLSTLCVPNEHHVHKHKGR
eukprot:PhF_6_TR4637/c0_g1_i1/m.6486